MSRQDAQVVKEGALLQGACAQRARMYCSVYNYCGSKANRSLENSQISLVPHNFHRSSVSIQIKFCKVLDCLDPLTNPVGADHKECPGYSNELRCCQVCLVARDLASNLSCTSGCNCDLWRPGWSRVAEIKAERLLPMQILQETFTGTVKIHFWSALVRSHTTDDFQLGALKLIQNESTRCARKKISVNWDNLWRLQWLGNVLSTRNNHLTYSNLKSYEIPPTFLRFRESQPKALVVLAEREAATVAILGDDVLLRRVQCEFIWASEGWTMLNHGRCWSHDWLIRCDMNTKALVVSVVPCTFTYICTFEEFWLFVPIILFDLTAYHHLAEK